LVGGVGQDDEQEPAPIHDSVGDGGVAFGGDPAGLTVPLGADGSGDVSFFLHGLAFLWQGLVSGMDWTGFGAGFGVDASLNSIVRRWGIIFGKADSQCRGVAGFGDLRVDAREKRRTMACRATEGCEWSGFIRTFYRKLVENRAFLTRKCAKKQVNR
jgi:hypothetical protein